MEKPTDFLAYMADVIAQLRAEERHGTAHVYQSTYNRVSLFLSGASLAFEEVTPLWLKQFQEHLFNSLLRWNTVSTYMRMLRAVYLRAVDAGYASFRPRLFSGVCTGTHVTVKRSVGPSPFRQLSEPLPAGGKLEETRILFLLLFMLRGIPFVDMAYLRRCDLEGDKLTYRRCKTGTELTVHVEPEAMALIHRLRSDIPQSPYLFPLIQHPGRDEYRQYSNALRSFNYRLKQLSALLKLKTPLTSYSARHSWATIANNRAYHHELIRDAMGHSSVKVTETYFKQADGEKVDRMNREILSYVFKN